MAEIPNDPRWYKDKRLLQGARQEFGSLERAAFEIGGVSPSTLQKEWKRQGLERLPRGPQPREPHNIDALRKLHERVYGGS